ncbi:MAG: Holliday junction resolvase RecU [Coprobacillaceae bacterium]
MVNYPNKKKNTQFQSSVSSTKKVSAKHRGMNLEEDLNITNQYYLVNDVAVIYKKPTPVQIVKVDYPKRSAARIVEAYYRTPSTTDYNGLYKGKYIDFEAKETRKTTFPFANITTHQIEHLSNIIKHNGIAFIIIAFTTLNEVYLIDALYMINAYNSLQRKSLKYEEIKENGHLIPQGFNPRLHYLKIVDELYF